MASKASYNEQLKLVSSSLQGLGLALSIATAGSWWTDGFAAYLVFWVGVAMLLFSIAYVLLGNLEEHDL